jgi:hypothetical protein
MTYSLIIIFDNILSIDIRDIRKAGLPSLKVNRSFSFVNKTRRKKISKIYEQTLANWHISGYFLTDSLVISKIRLIESYYAKLEYALPEQLMHDEIAEELEKAKNEIKKIIDEDLKNIRRLATNQKKVISFTEFSKPPSIIKRALYIEGDPEPDQISYYYSHWIMSLSSLQSLAQNAINMSAELKTCFTNYVNSIGYDRRIAFAHFVDAYRDFNGYLTNLRRIITQYHDLFILTCNELDPNHKEEIIIAKKSDITHDQLLDATKELLLRGNYGRLGGFALIRSAVEIFITRELFDLKKSQKYSTKQIFFPKKKIPSVKSIWKRIEKLQLAQYFKTDSLKRLYAWESIVAHRGTLAEEYLIWFVYYHTAIEIIGAFKANLKRYGDQILEELQKDGMIQIG